MPYRRRHETAISKAQQEGASLIYPIIDHPAHRLLENKIPHCVKLYSLDSGLCLPSQSRCSRLRNPNALTTCNCQMLVGRSVIPCHQNPETLANFGPIRNNSQLFKCRQLRTSQNPTFFSFGSYFDNQLQTKDPIGAEGYTVSFQHSSCEFVERAPPRQLFGIKRCGSRNFR